MTTKLYKISELLKPENRCCDCIDPECVDANTIAISAQNLEYLLQVARKAEEMAKFYGDRIISIKYHTDGVKEEYTSDIRRDDYGGRAREFLSFLEKGE